MARRGAARRGPAAETAAAAARGWIALFAYAPGPGVGFARPGFPASSVRRSVEKNGANAWVPAWSSGEMYEPGPTLCAGERPGRVGRGTGQPRTMTGEDWIPGITARERRAGRRGVGRREGSSASEGERGAPRRWSSARVPCRAARDGRTPSRVTPPRGRMSRHPRALVVGSTGALDDARGLSSVIRVHAWCLTISHTLPVRG